MATMSSLVGLDQVEEAARRLKGVVRPTSALHSSALSKLTGRPVFVKPEHFQRTGSFKIWGAYNRISVVAADGAVEEIVAAPAGDHAQGVALAASLCRLRPTVFMPQGASLPKVETTRAYGADVRSEPGNVNDAIAAEVILTLEARDLSHRDQVVPCLQAQGFRAQADRR
jgi:threonine dehydratase